MKALVSMFLVLGFSAAAMADGNPAYEVLCTPRFRAQGTKLSVTILSGTRIAQLSYGAPSQGNPVRVLNYQTQKSQGRNLSTLVYAGPGFSLQVDSSIGSGHLKADINGQTLDVDDLACDVQEFRPRM